ncbi:hypothetical protein Zmor_026512 [Zophobas morio]|uniref:Gustatory receptor n=1 Tax=Zophobas morio TaxID=2755281 RepID=A0AA38HTM3_9CUCU|nr:hypothetical protein Zmor_026512 [Zophobas morio]
MGVVEDIPVVVKCVLRLVGIVQISNTSTKHTLFKILPIPFWGYYFYISFNIWADFASITYPNVTNILKYSDCVSTLSTSIFMFVDLYMFYKRDNQLKKIVQTLDDSSVGVTKYRKNTYYRNFLLLLMLFNMILIVCGLGVLINTQYHLSYYIAISIFSLDVLFVEILFNDLIQKFRLINDQILTIQVLPVHQSVPCLDKLSNFHYHLVNVVCHINKVFEITLLVGTASWFFMVINEIYYLIFVSFRLSSAEFSFYWSQLPLMACYCFSIYYQVKVWRDVQDEANKSVIFVHDLWNSLLLKGKVGGEVRHLQLISLRMINTKLELTARGFFPLNGSFLYIIIAAVTTHVIILIQFEI